MAALDDMLAAHPFFKGFEADLAIVRGCARMVTFEPGRYLFREDGSADEFFLIEKGAVALEIHAPGRVPVSILTLGDGDLVGASWLVPPYRWAFDARAVRPTRAIGIDARRLRAACEADPRLGYELMKRLGAALVRRLHGTRLQILDVYARPEQ